MRKRRHINRRVDFVEGVVSRLFDTAECIDYGSTSAFSLELSPSKLIVVTRCFTISGHSGGPAVDDDGNVVGILSYGMTITDRNYIVPASEIEPLVNRVRERLLTETRH